MRDKIVVTIEPPKPNERLDVAEAFKQVLDFLELVEQAAGESAHFDWKLEKAFTNSPFTVVAFTPGSARAVARGASLPVAQTRVQNGLNELSDGAVPPWMNKRQRTTARKIMKRYRGGIGRVALKTDEAAKRQFFFNSTMAAKALTTLEKVDGVEDIFVPAHRGYGEVEGTLLEVSDFRGKPALYIHANGYDVVRCMVDESKLANIGGVANMQEVWQHSRVRLVGSLWFSEGGNLDHVAVDAMDLFPSRSINLAEVVDSTFTAGLSPSEYLDRLHEGSVN